MHRFFLALVIVCLTTSSGFAQSAVSDRPSVRVRLTAYSGERVTGRAYSIKSDVMEFSRDGDETQITLVQMTTIRLIERGYRRAARPLAIAAGAGTGFLGAIASIIGGLVWCNDEHVEGSCWGLMQGLAFIGSPILGGLLGWHLGRTNWLPVNTQELEKMLAQPELP
jgi:hypothetical protein